MGSRTRPGLGRRMDVVIQDDSDSEADVRPQGTLISLPDELAEWADQNQELVLRIQNALSETYDKLTEDQIWEVIAANSSAEWRKARADLRIVEEEWADLRRPENTPLGSIGEALDSDETNVVREKYTISLSQFTVINEGLRRREDLRNLLGVLLVQKRMLDMSTEHTQMVQRQTDDLAELTSIRPAFRKAARRRTHIGAQFKLYAEKLFAPKEKEHAVKTVPVPWSPET